MSSSVPPSAPRLPSSDLCEADALLRLQRLYRALVPSTNQPLSSDQLRSTYGFLEEEFGYLGNTVPAAYGGQGMSFVDFGRILEGLAPALPFLGNHSVQRYLYPYGEVADWLTRILSGQAIAGVAVTEPSAGSDVRSGATVAVRRDGDWEISGTKTWVTHAMKADLLIVLARLSVTSQRDMWARFLVPVPSEGLSVRGFEAVGLRHLTFGDVTLSRVVVPPRYCLDPDGGGMLRMAEAFTEARALVAIQSVGIGMAAHSTARRFLKSRVQFGRQLSAMDALRLRFADNEARLLSARVLANRALELLDVGDGGAATAAALAKRSATRMATELVIDSARLMGGSALKSGTSTNRWLDDARMLEVADGTAEMNGLVAGKGAFAQSEVGAWGW